MAKQLSEMFSSYDLARQCIKGYFSLIFWLYCLYLPYCQYVELENLIFLFKIKSEGGIYMRAITIRKQKFM